MPNPIVECIPNFSEARRPEVVEAIISAIQSVPGIHILDRHSDMDHNRTVLTFVGMPAQAAGPAPLARGAATRGRSSRGCCPPPHRRSPGSGR